MNVYALKIAFGQRSWIRFRTGTSHGWIQRVTVVADSLVQLVNHCFYI